jgi:CelD/BcsL family acetyltransferase involved in cellulose biosynthesis
MSQSVTLAGDSVPRQATSRAAALPFARVEVHTDPRAALDAWTELEAVAPITGYQTRRFLLPWLDTLGERRGFSALISVARDASGRPVALLPLGLARRGPFNVALFLGDRQSNFNLPLVRPDVHFDRARLRSAAHGNRAPRAATAGFISAAQSARCLGRFS